MKSILRIIACTAALLMSLTAIAATNSDTAPASALEQLALLKDDTHTPALPQKQKVAIREYMLGQARRLKNAGYKVETMRKGEVIVVTIPTDKMFAPNDSVLYLSAQQMLQRFVPYLRTPGMYKLVLAAHSDDTGSEAYQLQLTDSRIIALYDFFEQQGVDTPSLIGYPLGSIKPLCPNDSRTNRAANRRIEIYIVPDQGLIDLARQKRL